MPYVSQDEMDGLASETDTVEWLLYRIEDNWWDSDGPDDLSPFIVLIAWTLEDQAAEFWFLLRTR